MLTLLFAALFPLLCFIISELIIKKFRKKQTTNRPKKDTLYDSLITTVFVEWAVLIGASVISCFFMANDSSIAISPIAIAIASILPFAALLTKNLVPNKKISAFLAKSAVCAIAVLIAEIVIFNGKSFGDGKVEDVITSDRIINAETLIKNGDDIIISSNTSIEITNFSEDTDALILEMTQENTQRMFGINISMKDDNFARSYVMAQDKYTNGAGEELTFSFNPYGKIHSLKLSFYDISSPVAIHSMKAVGTLPFSFSIIRYLILFAIAVLLIAIKEFKLYKLTYQHKKLSHIIIAQGMVVICTLSALLFFKPDDLLTEYNKDFKNTADPYSMTFDAFMHDQLHLDFTPEEGLDELGNVYEWTQRTDSGKFYLWDYAFYNNKYYCYFGVAPVIALYVPTYLLTGKIPTVDTANSIFVLLAIIFICQTILAAVRLLSPRPNLLLLLASMPAAVCSIGAYLTINAPSMYNVAIASGLCFLFLCLWLGFSACTAKNKSTKFILLAISGLSLAFCVASRPSMSLSSAVLIPFFLGILLNKNEKLSYRITQASCFLVPLIIGGIAIMWYNNARFSSPFDFGAEYQLTVSDIHANKARLSSLPGAFIYYFLVPPRLRSQFPFFDSQYYSFNNYGSYVYVSDTIGALAYPMILFGIVMCFVSIQKKGNTFAYGVTKLQRKAFTIISLTMALFIAWQDYCLGGVAIRYIVDILPLLTLVSLIAIFRSNVNPAKNKQRYILSGLSMALTFCMCWLLAIGNIDGNINERCPNLYDTLENLLVFWS